MVRYRSSRRGIDGCNIERFLVVILFGIALSIIRGFQGSTTAWFVGIVCLILLLRRTILTVVVIAAIPISIAGIMIVGWRWLRTPLTIAVIGRKVIESYRTLGSFEVTRKAPLLRLFEYVR